MLFVEMSESVLREWTGQARHALQPRRVLLPGCAFRVFLVALLGARYLAVDVCVEGQAVSELRRVCDGREAL